MSEAAGGADAADRSGAADGPYAPGGQEALGRTRVLFVGGLGRSGTTLLERLLGELPGVVSLGEVVHLWERGLLRGERCGCGRPFRECPFWGKVGEIAVGGWDGFDVEGFLELKRSVDRTRFIPRLGGATMPRPFRERVTEYAGHYARLYRAACEVAGAVAAVDSSKHASLAFCLRWMVGHIDLRVLHVVRDSRAVAHSWTRQVRRPEAVAPQDPAAGGGEEYMARWAPARTSVHWNAQNLAFEWLGRRGTPTTVVRYEDFLRAPADSLGAIAGFAGLDVGGLAFLSGDDVELSANHTAAGNPMRFQTGRVRLRRDDSWRTGLGPADRRLVTALTLPLLRRHGYLGRSRPPREGSGG
jgi:hypothetical protein